jgi:hypothetical protein
MVHCLKIRRLERFRTLLVAAAAAAGAAGAVPGGAALASAGPLPNSAPPLPRHSIAVSDAANGATIRIHTGTRVTVRLGSTYWTFQGSSNPAVLRQVGTPTVKPRGGCVPGAGCGTVTATFVARHPGTATVTASRTTCGEALRCTGGQGSYTLTVVVRRTG